MKNTWRRKILRKTVVALQNKEQLFVSKIYSFICYLYVFKLFCVCGKRYRKESIEIDVFIQFI